MAEISVIVPVYQVENYVKDCIESILNQSFSDFELILVDDGSTDGSGMICEEYAAKDRRVSVIHQKNAGLSSARNTGIRNAKGKYLCFVDSDDYINRDFCKILYEACNKNDCDFAVCSAKQFTVTREINELYISNPIIKLQSNRAYFNQQLETGFSAWGKLYHSNIFSQISFFEGKLHEDIIWSSDLARLCKNGVCIIEADLYYYRQRKEGIMASTRKQCSADRVFAGAYLYNTTDTLFPELRDKAFTYAVSFPWSFVDGIYVHKQFRANKSFLKELQTFLRDNADAIVENTGFSEISKRRMKLFSKNRILYGFNAYSRLLRVYLYRIFHKDAYKDGHGI